MKNATAILSLLHETPSPACAVHRFRGESVLAWTLRRLKMCLGLANVAILCWEDQMPLVQGVASDAGAFVLTKGPRCPLPMVEAVAAANKWCDGWRGGMLGACHFDVGFHAAWANEIVQKLQAEAAIIVPPDAALVDPSLIGSLIAHAEECPQIEYAFAPVAPGLSGILLRASLMNQLSAGASWPGRMLCYWPDLPGRDPISKDECAPAPTTAARTLHRFNLDSERQISRMERATLSLNGTLQQSSAEQLVSRLDSIRELENLPRDIHLEISTTRTSRPIYWPGRHAKIDRAGLSTEAARSIFAELSAMDDIRLTLGGVGDPLLAENIFEIVEAAHRAGIRSIHIETDLIGLKEGRIERVLESPIDILSVYLPATSRQSYQEMMGVDLLSECIENLKKLVLTRTERKRGVPVVVPTFVKCAANLHEMEAWYDHWLRAVGSAVIIGPPDYCGLVDVGAVDMRPPRRVPCRRLRSRLSILSDGSIVACEQDVLGRHVLGRIGQQSIAEVWQSACSGLRGAHEAGEWMKYETCAACREWHRP